MSINSIYNTHQIQILNSKTKETNNIANISKPIKQSNVNFKGTEALAAYNYSLVNKDEIFNLPIVKPLNISTNPEEIKGEKIYDSKGNLVRIINDNNDQKEVYYFSNDNKQLSYYTKEEKHSGIKWKMYLSKDTIFVDKINPNGIRYSTGYENGKIIQIDKIKMYPNGDEEQITYSPEINETSVSKYYTKNGHNYSSIAVYDKNKKCISAFETREFHDKCTDLYFKNGIPYKMKTTESKAISNSVGKDDINLLGLEPDEPLKINIEQIKYLEGEKKYFSNGQIEQIKTPDGVIYNFDLNGLKNIKTINKEYIFMMDDDGKYSNWDVITDLGNGLRKRTSGWNNNKAKDVYIENDEKIIREISYNEKGIINYFKDSEAEIARFYDQNGNLLNVWDND